MDLEECLNSIYRIREAISGIRTSSNSYRKIALDDIDEQMRIVDSMLIRLLNADNAAEKLGASK